MLRNSNRSLIKVVSLFPIVLLMATGCGSNADPYDLDKELREDAAASFSAYPSSTAIKISPYSLGFIGLCETPDSLFEVKADSKLIDKGLLLPADVEGSLKTLGIDLSNRAEWLKDDIAEYGPIPDPSLFSDLEILAEDILKARISILNGRSVSVDEQVQNVEALFERGKKVCEWHEENS